MASGGSLVDIDQVFAGLTAQQREVVRLTCMGCTVMQIAVAMGILPQAVKRLRMEITGRFGAQTMFAVCYMAGLRDAHGTGLVEVIRNDSN